MQQRGKMDRIVVVFHYMIGVGFSYFVMGTENTTFIHFDGLYANKAAVRGNSTAG